MANFRKIRKAPAKELERYRLPSTQLPSKLVFILPMKNEGVSRTYNCQINVNAALLDC